MDDDPSPPILHLGSGDTSSGSHLGEERGQSNLGSIFFSLSVNFLMYTLLILIVSLVCVGYVDMEHDELPMDYVWRRLKRQRNHPHNDDVELINKNNENSESNRKSSYLYSNDTNTNIDVGMNEDEIDNDDNSGEPIEKLTRSISNPNDWGEPEGTRQEVVETLILTIIGFLLR
jgi:hypothetical protein